MDIREGSLDELTLMYGVENVETLDGVLGRTYKFTDTTGEAIHTYIEIGISKLVWVSSRTLIDYSSDIHVVKNRGCEKDNAT